ncbi:transmembrane 9 superfamily member 1 [Anolis carolinensis]|uniref:transmembrane 9 superfamily member 1 n=1 Tax=Anolis carolinensis TaxID=28377 RepID=UPI002F2B3CF2
MSGLGKLFGKGKKAKAPTPQEAIQKLRETEEVLVKKQEFLEQKIQQELQTAKKHGTKNKRAALQALKRKKRYEQQLGQIDGTLSTIEFQREALENATTNTEVLKTMSDAARAMKEAHQHMDIDKVDDLMAEITEQQDIAQQISDAISKPVGFGDDVDEDELLAELEEMEQEDLDKELLNVGEPTPELPSVPASRLPAVPASKVPAAAVDDDDEDMKQLAAWVSLPFSVFLEPLICPVLRVRLAAFFLSDAKVRERDLAPRLAFFKESLARGPQIASRALSSVVGFSARNLMTHGTLRTSKMLSRFEVGPPHLDLLVDLVVAGELDLLLGLSEQLLEVGVVEGQVGHHQGVEDDAHAPDVGEEGVVGQAQEDLWAGVGEAAAVGLAQVGDAQGQLGEPLPGQGLGASARLLDPLQDIPAGSQLHDDIMAGRGLDGLVETDHSGGHGKERCGSGLEGRRGLRHSHGESLGLREATPAPPLHLFGTPVCCTKGACLEPPPFLFLAPGNKSEDPQAVPGTALKRQPSSHPSFLPIMAHHPSLAFLFSLLFLFSTASSEGHYKQGEAVMLYVNKVGPYHNPQETYHYYQLPVCSPDNIRHKSLTLGEVLDGDRMAESMYEIRFRENVEKKVLCEKRLSLEEVDRLRQAIEELYYFEFVVDDLPLRGFVGYMEESGFLPHSHKIGLWTHLDFHLEWNGDRIIYANVSVRNVKPTSLDDVQSSLSITHTYSVRWSETASERRGERRGSRGGDDGFFPRTLEIHWLSIINSMVLVFLLVGFVVVILMRVLKNDLARYNLDEEASSSSSGDDFDQGDNGWKIIHTDVFRFPPCRSLLCAVLGVGSQFLALGTGIIVMALLGMFNVHRHGAINSAAILLYALTCCISGYVSSNFYRQIGGERWVWNILLTTSLFSAPFFLTWSVVNSVHWANGSTQALPATTILLLLTVWLLVGFPLTVIGGIFGKNRAGPFDAPCRTKNIAREIPSQPWYKSTLVHMTIGGFLPFSAISVELYYIFATVWGREQYTLYGILFFVFAILLSVGACISIALTYFQLSGEDYRWWWRSVMSTGSTGLFIFLYSVFYYSRRSNMSGAVQTVEFFGYSLLTGYVFFLMLGTISFFASLKFIRYIYVNLKMD